MEDKMPHSDQESLVLYEYCLREKFEDHIVGEPFLHCTLRGCS